MAEINNLYEIIEGKFDGRVQVASYNTYYDDAYEIRLHIERIKRESIPLPAVFIDEELVLAGRIDEPAIMQALSNRDLY